ncbi:molybdenum ABC transporter ATP-binding protein [Thiomicrorhabdus sediminis]|uniref:Molybdenum ABC transporter ATP-binding protein n=1 Tax=Thiomicrorhabdus sediminis TaxID=2580412 RepID=A0A4P9K751_9GAMM|nr:molybdenum ABC transporter ATP-binding protein [Thiomicrorhabdus sediminis]QCU90905.1 molybdenum ABC transporter ATP-binding protein [Thiomicrorhabdus sediminis]
MSLAGNLKLRRGQFVLDTGEFIIPSQGLTAIFGHSGSGKTSFLRALAGFENEVEGRLKFVDEVWHHEQTSLPTHKRQLGYVFQEASLFAHLNVLDNLKYGLKRVPKNRECQIHFGEVVDWLGLQELLTRSVQTLSGGERQRVAIARTLLAQPKVLLMDEPMAALDLFAKRAIMPYLERLRDELNIPIVYITHSPEEVERLADTVVFMQDGSITQIEPIEQALNRAGTPLYQNQQPRAVLAAQVTKHCDDGLTELQIAEQTLYIPHIKEAVGQTVRVVIAAEQVSLMAQQPQQSSMLNHLPVMIESIDEHNDYSLLLKLRLENTLWPLLCLLTKRSQQKLQLEPGQHWIAALKSVSILN